MATVELSEAEYREHCASYDGVCPDCGEIQSGDFEPDARKRTCRDCGGQRAMGVEWALVAGIVRLSSGGGGGGGGEG